MCGMNIEQNAEGAGGMRQAALVKLIIDLAVMAIPLTVAIQYRWLPNDDALRHAAKAVSGRAWTDVLVLREGAELDQHPGWHAFLGMVHGWTGGDAAFITVFSYIALFILFCLTPVPVLRRPEAWVAALLLCTVLAPDMFIFRLMRGRPYLFTMSVLTALLLIGRGERLGKTGAGGALLLIALATYVHSAWYVFVLLPMAFALAGAWRKAGVFAVCWLAGSLLGAALTGHPVAYLTQQFEHAVLSFSNGAVFRQLVGEFTPLFPAWPFPLLAVLIALMKKNVCGEWPRKMLRDPIFILAVLGWVMGLRVYRFWADWGLPALLLWMTFELEAMLDRMPRGAWMRVGLTLFLCGVFYLGATADREGIWSNQRVSYPGSGQSAGQSRTAPWPADEWMPGEGGIVYADSMCVFYDWFLDRPDAPWKYILGFESGLMPPDDLRIYRDLQYCHFDPRAYQPWVAKMRPQDRLVMRMARPEDIPGLEWKGIDRDGWIGRKPARENEVRP